MHNVEAFYSLMFYDVVVFIELSSKYYRLCLGSSGLDEQDITVLNNIFLAFG